MGLGKRVQERWGFTRQEVIAIIFLSTTFALGAGVRWLAPRTAPLPEDDSGLFAAADSEFAARSHSLLSDPSPPPRTLARPRRSDPPPHSIDLNTASAEELTLLPGIGEVTAKKIVAYRTKNGRFGRPEEVMEVSGIGPKKFAQMAPFLRAP